MASPVFLISFTLFVIEVIGKEAAPCLTKTGAHQASTSEKLIKTKCHRDPS